MTTKPEPVDLERLQAAADRLECDAWGPLADAVYAAIAELRAARKPDFQSLQPTCVMVSAGLEVYERLRDVYSDDGLVVEIYKAMAQAKP